MTVEFDAVSQGDVPIGSTSLTVAHTCSGSNRLLLVGVVSHAAGNAPVATVTYGGVPMGIIESAHHGTANDERLTVYALHNPPSGINNIVATCHPAGEITIAAISLTGAIGLGRLATKGSRSGGNTSLEIEGVDNGLVVDFFSTYNPVSAIATSGPTQTERVENNNGSGNDSAAGATATGSGKITVGWTSSGAGTGQVATAVEPFVAAAARSWELKSGLPGLDMNFDAVPLEWTQTKWGPATVMQIDEGGPPPPTAVNKLRMQMGLGL